MSITLLIKPSVTWDNDAKTYLTNVENADNQSLEGSVARAINQFIVDCKIRGIWDAIKSSCLLCCARTLDGALVPLKGVAPTSYNFTNQDYNRETGLRGDGSSKYLNTNFSSSSLNLNSIHFSIYLSSMNSDSGPSGARTYIADFDRNAIRSGTGFGQIRVNNTDLVNYNISNANKFIGCSRNNVSNFILRTNSNHITLSATSSSFSFQNFRIFARYLGSGTAHGEFSNGRISFYSIGESLNLRFLEDCVRKLNLNLLNSLRYNSSDNDVKNYLSKIEAVDNYPLENSLRLAIHNFITGCKSDNIWDSIKTSCLLSGARTLRAALSPLVGISPTNFNFVESDYNRIGLLGNGSNKYLDSNRACNIDPQDNNHISCFVSTVPSIDGSYYMGVVYGASGTSYNAITSNQLWNRNGAQPYTKTTGFHGTSRNSSTSFIGRVNSTSTTNTATSTVPNSDKHFIFARNVGYAQVYTNARLSFYSIGENLDLSLLDNRVTSLMSSINNTI